MIELNKYIGECFHIDFEPEKNRFKVFTIPTQHFYIESLGELTPERFELEINKKMSKEEIDLGEMINVWIKHHGSLDLDTDEQTIIDFYNKNKDE